MATNRQPLVAQVAAPQHFVPPTPRELRGQAVHRLQVGMFGLAAMLLLVGLANIIMDRAKLSDDAGVAVQAGVETSSAQGATDPLADIGVVPAADSSPTAPTKSAR